MKMCFFFNNKKWLSFGKGERYGQGYVLADEMKVVDLG